MQSELKRAQNENEKPRRASDTSSIAQVISKAAHSLPIKSDRSSSSVAKSPTYAARHILANQDPPSYLLGLMVLLMHTQLAILQGYRSWEEQLHAA